MQPLRIIIAGGGTGGHIFPAVAIGHALQRLRPGTELLFVGANGKMEMEKVPQEGFKIVGLDIAGFNRSNLLKNILLPFKLLMSLFRARSIIKEFKPHAAVGVGGYASFPILRQAQQLSIPTLIQEQNSYAGKSNQILAKRAKAICVAYEGMAKFFPADRVVLTGNPVRKVISASSRTQEEGCAHFGLNAGKKTILVVGGSLGAKSINEAIETGLSSLLGEGIQLLWQTGKPFHQQALEAAKGKEELVKVHEFIRDMDLAYAAADLVVSRAGALAIAELCIAAKPVVFVPYPHAAEDHQTSNAQALVSHGAAQMVRDVDAAGELVPKIQNLLHDQTQQDIMRQALAQLAIRDADERIAQAVLSWADKTIQTK
jgi:UDP-N-acetylglucosamine--N-acetylmuramyl-(pentapeptide) pyrophosphoryl-undecaprenol N-acetylglucosamine transferase